MKPRQHAVFAAADSFSVQLPDFVRTTTFRWTAGAFAVCILLFSAFVYWEAAQYMLAKTDAALNEESLAIAADTPDRQLDAIDDRLRQDPRRIRLAGLFRPDGHRIVGNLENLPHGLEIAASKRDPFERRLRPVALAASELAGVAETVRARVV
jgi:hypothetical protein